MSVINKMLRDLDQRQAGQPAVGKPMAASGERLTQGTLPLGALQRPSHGASRRPWVWATAMLLAAAAVGVYLLTRDRPQAPQVPPVVADKPTPVARPQPVAPAGTASETSTPTKLAQAVALPVPQPAVAQVEPKPEAASAKPLPSAPKAVPPSAQPTQTVPAPKAVVKVAEPKSAPQKPAVAPVPAATPGGETDSLRMDSSLMRLPKASEAAPQADTGRSAALEALAQAQSLWNSGSHAAAIELLQQALARVEGSSVAAGQSGLASLARELARMELADGQASQALLVLTRLELQLSQMADVWAMRGNAAQRLGRHAEAAQSYKQALALKPDEPRWMLGAAVSLAAQGQTAAAAELADKARAMGALRPDVANYLRQLGVSIRAD